MVEHIRDLRSRNIVPYLSIGHRLGDAADPEIVALLGRDLFESNNWVSAVEYERALAASEILAADAWGADRSFYLVDGSSAGNHALLLATVQPGDEVIVSRDVHWSIMVALILTGARPIYVTPEIAVDHDVGIGISPVEIERALVGHPHVKLVIIVSPSWCGVASDLAAIAVISHAHGVPLYVDEAWGPHVHFHPDLPTSAMTAGADAAVTSVHKILPAVSQGSLLNIRGNLIDRERVATSVRMVSTTSPMLPIVATLYAARRQMALEGAERLQRVIDLSRQARSRIWEIGGYNLLSPEGLGIPATRLDITKFVIDVHNLGMTGFDVENRLNGEFSIAIESADWRGIVANFNLGETEASAIAFVDALFRIAETDRRPGAGTSNLRATGEVVAVPEQAMTPRDAYFSTTRRIRLADAEGEIAAELVTPYPPGIPILAPGEVISRARIDYLLRVYERGAVNYGNADWNEERMISVVASAG